MYSKKELAIALSKLKPFTSPKQRLEQYSTDSEVAATILWDAYMKGDIEGKNVADLGCGTGILGIGALLLGAKKIYFVDIDESIIDLVNSNAKQAGVEDYELVNCDVSSFDKKVDTVIMNPPFGTQRKHIDLVFLEKAASILMTIISLHKTSTIEYLKKWALKNSFRVETQTFSYPLKSTLSHHKKRIERIEVSALYLRKD